LDLKIGGTKVKRTFLIFAFVVFSSLLCAKTAALPDIMKPEQISVDENSLYITNSHSYAILVYSKPDFKLTGNFGKKGEGPGEFTMIPQIFLKKEEILVLSGMKYYRFSPKGILLEEKRRKSFFGLNQLVPIEDNFVIGHFTNFPEAATEICLVNDSFEKTKTLYHKKNPPADFKKPLSLVNPKVSICSSGGKIYLANPEKGLHIEIYNAKGKKIMTINSDYKKIAVTNAHRKKIKEDFMNSRGARRFRAHFKKRKFSFPDFFPAIDIFFVSNEKIYIKTYNFKGGEHEYLILNLKGDLIKSVFLPESANKLYTIENGIYYYLSENEESEKWEIHTINIE
jgi:hypothetical protein